MIYKISEQKLTDIKTKFPDWDFRKLLFGKNPIQKNISDQHLVQIYQNLERETGKKFTDEHFRIEKLLSGPEKKESGGMLPETIEAFNKMKKVCPNLKMDEDSYRTFQKQGELFKEYINTYGSIEGAMKLRALPGFSQHHEGKAIDVEPTSVRPCVSKNASKFGFEFPYKGQNNYRESEPWHIYYVGNKLNENKIPLLIKQRMVNNYLNNLDWVMWEPYDSDMTRLFLKGSPQGPEDALFESYTDMDEDDETQEVRILLIRDQLLKTIKKLYNLSWSETSTLMKNWYNNKTGEKCTITEEM